MIFANRFLLTAIITLSFFAARSQVFNRTQAEALQAYFFIPVEFDQFGKWLAQIEADTSIVFKEKNFYAYEDSINLNFKIEKPGFNAAFNGSHPKLSIVGRTHTTHQQILKTNARHATYYEKGPPVKVTHLTLMAIIPFDSTATGKNLAAKTQRDIEKNLDKIFGYKTVINPGKPGKRKSHPETERVARFRSDKFGSINCAVFHTFHDEENQVYVSIYYDLIN